MMLISKINKLGWKRYTHKPVCLLMGSEAPCCDGGVSGIFLLIIHFIFLICNNPQIQYFPTFRNFKHPL